MYCSRVLLHSPCQWGKEKKTRIPSSFFINLWCVCCAILFVGDGAGAVAGDEKDGEKRRNGNWCI